MTDKKIIRVGDCMTKGIITIEAMATVADAVRLMTKNDTSSLVVERRSDADEHGMITVKDIAGEVLAKDLSADRVNVSEVMSKPVFTLPEEMNVVYAVRLLIRFKMTRALVVDHDRDPRGMVTLRDMVIRSLDKDGG